MASPRIAFTGDVNALGSNGDSLAYTPAPAGLPFLGGVTGSTSNPGPRGGLGGGNTGNTAADRAEED